MKILYVLPSRSRPQKLQEALKNLYAHVVHDDFEVLVNLDEDDKATLSDKELMGYIDGLKEVTVAIGKGSGSKVEAINRFVAECKGWNILFCISDDMSFVVKGFDKIVIGLFQSNFKDMMGVLHTWDGITNERQISMAIFNKAWYDYFGYIYNPIYKSVYCDTEMKDVAEILGAYHMEPIVIARHLHPAWGLATMDDLYRRNEDKDTYRLDCETYNNRRRINFGLPTNYGG